LEVLLRASNLTVDYTMGDIRKRAVDGVFLDIFSAGYKLGVVGESGSGKTTLGMSMMGLIEPPGEIVQGRLEYLNRNLFDMAPDDLRKYRGKEVSMVFQSAMNALNPVKKAADHITELIAERTEASKSEARDKALKLLSEVGIEAEHSDDFPHELSGGMKQRVMIAMALALSPKLLIADEPTSALDVVVQKQILHLLKKEISKLDLSLVFITHDIPLLSGLVDDVAVMFAGDIVEKGPTHKVFNEHLHPYTEELLSSLLTIDSDFNGSRVSSKAIRFSQSVATTGCKYRFRCKYAFDRCEVERPVLKDAGNGVYVPCHKYDQIRASS
jgi:oligopeptide/dipeptide ABC transporter ATP-binding protein